jgi:hypothetical protein
MCILSFTLVFLPFVFADQQTTITGVVNDTYQIIGKDGTVYEVADTDVGNDLLNHVGKTVQATGIVTEEEGVKVISVESYTVAD